MSGYGGDGYFLGKGMLAIADSAGNMRFAGNISDFSTNVEFETLEIYDNTKATKTLDKEFKLSTNPGWAGVMRESKIPENLALGLSGSVQSTTVQSLAVDEAIASGLDTKKGCFLDLGKKKITSITFTTPAAPTVTTDYILYGDAGLLYIPYTSTIADATEIAGTITYSACTYKTISMFSADTVEREMWFSSATTIALLKMWRATVKPAGDLTWISDEEMLIPLEGKLLDDSTNHASPYHFGKLEMEDVKA